MDGQAGYERFIGFRGAKDRIVNGRGFRGRHLLKQRFDHRRILVVGAARDHHRRAEAVEHQVQRVPQTRGQLLRIAVRHGDQFIQAGIHVQA